jgi:hypothetical protein
MTASDHSRRARQPLWAWLRLCLLLTLWQAPVPLVHAHEAGGWDHEALARHVHEFHGDAAVPGECEWHWHLVLPAWCCPAIPTESDDEPAGPVQVDVTVVRLDDSVERDATVAIVADEIDWRSPRFELPAWRMSATAGSSFLTTYSIDVPLHQLLRVIRR